MTEYVTVGKIGSIAEGEGASFRVGDYMVAVFLHHGEFHAINDICPHQGASLGAGCLDDEGSVMCPWHAWRFDIRDGTWRDSPRIKTECFDVRIVGDEIKVATTPR